ncbi:MAG: HAD hydrolase-like protein [Anaerolineae bacterium]|nr:HAD hydrolase-like protein [Anaerolineae bacterium]
MKRLVILDLDGTLVETYSSHLLPNTAHRLKELAQEGYHLAIATNQAGLSWRVWTGKTHYPTPASLSERFHATVAACPELQNHAWFVSVYDPRVKLVENAFQEVAAALTGALQGTLPVLKAQVSADPLWRKPQPGMLFAACRLYTVPVTAALFVGDMKSDAEAAYTAGMDFMQAEVFFAR